ncbi:hypothetical protein TTHERM_000852779 (macronuclear) [Tetrahymena thermophila SB210]|uniref:Uncharacterized protein n=1 Tax=Tetrahymena thermophila (strain SB210) TaxID=312017 RepID=W7X1B5_TETTS|nr:hypothetical protein TTHERM_000852779 [Tetrahymena thermophila SB210]EWS71367.1 hypothetical protein TTHERM_000852779 [Tetrahymena thermophila SB210]|eukprot:XP_012656100.1 hypothetical protein TTHERM_000852779 [Tetrahymena thermophila SB210]
MKVQSEKEQIELQKQIKNYDLQDSIKTQVKGLTQVTYSLVPNYIFQSEKCFFIPGDIIFDFDCKDKYFFKVSKWNEFKRVYSCAVRKDMPTVEIQFFSQKKPNYDLSQVIHQLQNSQNQELYDLSLSIQQYSKMFIAQEAFSNRGKQILDQIPFAVDYLSLVNQYFKEQCEILLKSVSDSQQFYIYGTQELNFNSSNLELTKLGISENLIALLGSNIEQFQQIIMRYGLIDFYEQQSYQKLFQQTVQNKQINNNQKNECFMELLTYDQIKVKVTVQNQNHVFLNNVKNFQTIYDLFLTEEQRLCFFYKNMYITYFEVDLYDLKKVIEIRKQNLNNCSIQFLEDNIEYSSQCLYLLEKFYSNQTQNIQTNQICNYRNLK